MSIRVRLLALFSLVVVAGLVGFLALWLFGVPGLGIEGMFSQEIRRATTSTEVLTDKERDTYEHWLAEHRRSLRSWSQLPELSLLVQEVSRAGASQASRDRLARRLTVLRESSPGNFRRLYVVAADGKRVLSSAGNEVRNAPAEHQEAVQESLLAGMTESVRLQLDGVGAGLLAVQQIPVFDRSDQPTGAVAGVVLAELGLETQLAADAVSIARNLGSGGAVVLADAKGEVLLDSSAVASNPRNRYVASQLVAGSEASRILNTPQGEEVIATFRHLHLGATDTLSLIAIRGTDEALHAVRASFMRTGLLVLLLAILTFVLLLSATARVAQAQAQVLALNAGLEDRIRERTMELASANENLTQTLARLERTRSELVRSEKLAALGAMVAGVSHELNTPLGNSLMAASTMQDHTEVLSQALDRGIKRSELVHYTEQMQEGNAILMASLQRAAELVASFKQVAADQTSAQRRFFLLDKTVDEILLTLGPTIRKSGHRVEVDVAAGIRMDSYPGPLGQVLSNLINNSLLHAFESVAQRLVQVVCRHGMPGQVHIVVRDNGCGIPEQHLGRIFDPFFTTKLGKGGSGLGLNIVYNLVTEVLGGDIQVRSIQGEGTTFTITLPLVSPYANEAARQESY
ncbi:MAG: hypothetical protein E6Q49_03860 [Limnohabitans sp.]|nr:MAG: hypothetical protein E6Q49_03860 [Limnohabitans sp.]